MGSDLSVTNTGSITGGMSGDTVPVQADAIDFTGGTNSLTLSTTASNGGLSGGLGLGGTVTITPDAGGTTLTSVLHDYSATTTGSLVKTGVGTLSLDAANIYSGGTTLNDGTLELGQQSSASAGAITFGSGASETLQLDFAGTLQASVSSFAADGDAFDLTKVADTATASYANGMLTVSDGTHSDQIAVAAAPSGDEYAVSNDGNGHALVKLAAIPAPTITTPKDNTETNNPKPTIAGTGESGDTVDLSIALQGGGTTTATTLVTNGAWTYTPTSALADGSYSVSAVETSPSGTGTSAQSNTETFTVDTVAPTVAITSQGGPTNQADQTITGTVDTADAGTTVSVYDNSGTTAVGSGVVQKNGTWSAPITLAQGTNTLVAKDTDAAGNTGTSNTVTYTLDTTAPTITSDTASPATGDLGAGKGLTFTLATSEPVTVTGSPTLTLNDGGTATYDASASTSTSLVFTTTTASGQNASPLAATGVNLPNGATIRDAAGNNANLAGAAATFNGLQVDTTPPTVSSPTLTVQQNAGPTPIGIGAPMDNETPTGSLAITAGMTPTDGTVTLASGQTVTTGEGLTAAELEGLEFTPTPGAFDQGSTFTYTATDQAGNASTGTAALDIGGANAPTITGTHASSTTAQAPVDPFTGVTVSDPSMGTETLTIALRNGGGTLTGPGLVVSPNGTYTLTGSAAAVTQDLDALSFTPTAPAAGTSATTTFVLNDASSAGTSVSNAGTSVTDTAAPAPAADTVTFNPNAAYIGDGQFVLSGTASSAAGVKSIAIDARIGGVGGNETFLGNATVNPNGTWTFGDYVGSDLQGFITATETDNAGGTASVSPLTSLQAGIRGQSFQAIQDFYTPDGTYAAKAYEKSNGARTVRIRDDGQTLTSQFHDTFANGGVPDTTFVFDPGYGNDVIQGLRLTGQEQDNVSLPSSDFASFAQVLQDTQSTPNGAVIHDNTSGDTLLLAGVNKAELAQHQANFSFHA